MATLFFKVTIESDEGDNPNRLRPYLIEALEKIVKGSIDYGHCDDPTFGLNKGRSKDNDYAINVKWVNFDGVIIKRWKEIGVWRMLAESIRFKFVYAILVFIEQRETQLLGRAERMSVARLSLLEKLAERYAGE